MKWLAIPTGCLAVVVIATLLAAPAAAPTPPPSDPAGCAPCHDRRRPIWHDDDVTAPGRDREARRAHAAVAAERGGCDTCHRRRFFETCGGCHDATERWRQGAP